MSQDSEKYLHFQVSLLKGSSALDALRKDALKYHMIDHPGQLIAMRLTEYYEIMSGGQVHPGASVALAGRAGSAPSTVSLDGSNQEWATEQSGPELVEEEEGTQEAYTDDPLTTSADVEQNAEDAAEYWSLL